MKRSYSHSECTIGTKRSGSSRENVPLARLSTTAASRGEASTASDPAKPARCFSATSSPVMPNMLGDLDVGAVQSADCQGAIQGELHVAGAGCFHPGGRDLLGQIGRRDNPFGERGAVVWHEHHLQPVADGGVTVHDPCNVIGELDN